MASNAQSFAAKVFVAAAIRRYRLNLSSKQAIVSLALIVQLLPLTFTPANALTPAFKALIQPKPARILDSATLAARARKHAKKAKPTAEKQPIGGHVDSIQDCREDETCDISYDPTYKP